MCDLERRPQLEYPGYSGKKILIQFRCIIFYHILYVLVFFNDQIYVYIKVYRPGGRVGEGGGGGGGEDSHMKKTTATRVPRLETRY